MMEVTLTRRTAERLIEAATAAPSVHNSQPWRFVAWPADRVIEIYADPARTRRRGDPYGRAVHIACGSALFNLRLAIAQAGYESVARLLPSRRDPLLLASVRLAGPYRPRPAERDLYAAIRLIGRGPLAGRHTAGRSRAAEGHGGSLTARIRRPLASSSWVLVACRRLATTTIIRRVNSKPKAGSVSQRPRTAAASHSNSSAG
jgi:hypothetical protein